MIYFSEPIVISTLTITSFLNITGNYKIMVAPMIESRKELPDLAMAFPYGRFAFPKNEH